MANTSEIRECVLCTKKLDLGSGIAVAVGDYRAWVCGDECKAEFDRIEAEQAEHAARLAQPGWLLRELPPNSDAFEDVMTDVERTERERDEE